jgi:hypothetical protein
MNQNKKAIAQVNNTDGCSLGRESCRVFSVRSNDDDDDDDITDYRSRENPWPGPCFAWEKGELEEDP